MKQIPAMYEVEAVGFVLAASDRIIMQGQSSLQAIHLLRRLSQS